MRLFLRTNIFEGCKNIGDLSIKKKIETVLTSLGNAQNIGELSSVKKLKGHKSPYRIRVGDYRIGFFSGGETITLVRVLHRNIIYEYFP